MRGIGLLRRLTGIPAPVPKRSKRSFDHALAQRFEWKNNRQVIEGTFAQLYSDVEANRAAGGIWHSASDQFFCGDENLFASFVERVRSRKCLEIGSGPYGFLLPATWIKDRTIIEPLANKYRQAQLDLIGKTFLTDDVRVYTTGAEVLIDDLVGNVDGAIICRNALDHCEDALAIIANMSKYAANGCYLLLWTDIWHLQGIDDDGHHNITRSIEVMDALLEGLGFEILKHGALIRDQTEFIEYGRLARRK
jgi:hypothetical protein